MAYAIRRLVEHLLRGGRPAHQPAHVPGAQRVGVLRAEVARRVQGPVGDRHLDRDAGPGDDRVHLVGVRHADAGGPGVGARPARPGAERGRQLRVLAVRGDVLGVEDAVRDELGQVHHDRGVRPDRVRGDHIHVGVQRRVGGRRAAVQPLPGAGQFSQPLHTVWRTQTRPVGRFLTPATLDMDRGHDITPGLAFGSVVVLPLADPLPGARRCGRRRIRRWFPR